MKIALVGYGKMGHMIEECAKSCGHEVVATVDVVSNDASVKIASGDYEAVARAVKSSGAEGVIEFSHPTAVMGNIKALLPLGLPIVVGTTGWNDKQEEVNKLASECGGIIMTSSNFSIGVNMLYKIVAEAVKIMEAYPEYDIATWEAHHNQKADSPSGTAITLAETILANTKKKDEIVTDAFHERPKANQLHVSSTRCGSIPGTHTVFFDSKADTIEITHRARSREGFAMGSVHALERLSEAVKTGRLTKGKLYGMKDLF
ncbi:MAG: 4-hydroxy-tetrahydrodipicolinate reductase [Treponema sp.]|nr:4-hydroxy-tetrahydrodipicolinate reductase [Treponema sp.]